MLEGGLIKLPDPKTLTDGWVEAPANIPDTIYDNIMEYLLKHNAGKAFRGGKSLLESGYVSNIMTHSISVNLRYCIVRGLCVAEQKLSKDPYNVWVCLHKDNADVITGDCSCTAGYVVICLVDVSLHRAKQGLGTFCSTCGYYVSKPGDMLWNLS